MNTKIEYLYRDASNYKKFNCVIIFGEITSEQIDIIMSCCDLENLFIPEQVGLPAKRLEEFEFNSSEDSPYLELERNSFALTEKEPTCDITVEKLVTRFEEAKGNWHLENFGW